MDDIHLSIFSPSTRLWLREKFDSINNLRISIESHYISFETACVLYFILKEVPDCQFPNGKWATIQHLQEKLDRIVREAKDADI